MVVPLSRVGTDVRAAFCDVCHPVSSVSIVDAIGLPLIAETSGNKFNAEDAPARRALRLASGAASQRDVSMRRGSDIPDLGGQRL